MSTNFFTQFYQRLTSATPKFFAIIQAIAGIVAAVSLALTKADVAVPEWLLWLKSTTTLIVTIATAVIAQLPIVTPSTPQVGDTPTDQTKQPS
ncbi:hypothetical protein [Spirosoma foliorum]|uniref:Holin n=1 Tax=Spirosoma foliorum TaxID=2710596 RepID=A0A7G5H2L1_9BACT|nr:hypothetical protein [Spirosoma foliorum]QMW05353.1 hypothetical protein H3H32_10910 [Spirosoma foliorum]